MPGYGGDNMAETLAENRQALLFAYEMPPAGQASMAVRLGRGRGPQGCSLELRAPADPGPFEIAIEVADSDLNTSYIPVGEIGAGGPLSVPLNNFRSPFLRARCVTPPTVPITLMVSR